MLFLLLLLPSLLAALLALVVRPYRPAVGWSNAVLSLAAFGAALGVAGHAIAGEILVWGPGDLFRADSLSALLMVCVSAVAAMTLFLSPGLGRSAAFTDRQLRRYHLFINLFIFSMLLAVSVNNIGIMWIAIEATTVFSAMVIPLTLSKASVEASWKYILICSVGIALAFVGTVLGYFDFVALSGRAENALNWPVLLNFAPHLHPEVMRIAFIFLLIGYGTKAGLAPMHTWLPDAHSESPATLSALMSGVLLAVAMYALLRWKMVVDATLGDGFTDTLLLTLGLLTLFIAAFSLVRASNYKRMLAYSSVEHTGLICIGLALGPIGTFAAMYHIVNHAAAKSMMFFLSGRILHRFHSTELGAVRGLLKVMPATAILFAAGMLALVGLPPFGLFMSEFALVRAGFVTGHPWLMALLLVLLAVAFVALLRHLNSMLHGTPTAEIATGEDHRWGLVPMLMSVAVLLVLGFYLPASFQSLLDGIAALVTH